MAATCLRRARVYGSSGACNLRGAVGRETAIAAPIIKLLWSPAREMRKMWGGTGLKNFF